jgi:hypothetical protein
MLSAVFVAGAQSAPEAKPTLVVDDDGRGTVKNCDANQLAFTSVQAAVDFASQNTTIKVCPGTYTEQVTVGKNKLKLQSAEQLQAIIKAPAVMAEPGDLVRITNGAKGVELKGFTVAGPLPDALFCSSEIRAGVKVDENASATIRDNHITEIRSASEALRGCQNGIAIAVGRDFADQIGKAKIDGNTIDLYQKAGVYVDGAGSNGTVTDNEISGDGPNPTIAQNGIQISRRAVGKVTGNTVVDHQYTSDPTSSTGILVFAASPDTEIRGNTVSRNDDNIALYDTLSILVKQNEATLATKYDGLYAADDSLNNRFEENTAIGNLEADCRDDSTGSKTSGTANTWTGNTGATSMPAGLCAPIGGEGTKAGAQSRAAHTASLAR